MCILFLHHHPSSSGLSCACRYVLVAADNRDEFFHRPTQPLAFWEHNNDILAGRDVESADVCEQGTWMGVSRKGRFAVLTNYRSHYRDIKPNARTRGRVVSEFLSGAVAPKDYSESLLKEGDQYNGFSTILADLKHDSEVVYCSNRGGVAGEGSMSVLGPGNYGLSNSVLDCPWRKVQRGKELFGSIITEVEQSRDEEKLVQSLMELLADDTCLHPDPHIPDTGFPEEVMKSVSSIFVKPIALFGKQYGTRTSSVVLVDRKGKVTFTERTLTFSSPAAPPQWTTEQHSFTIPASSL